jgi:hypothetical protein
MQAERLTTRLAELEWGWNQDFSGGAVYLPENGTSQPITLAGGMKITLLSPTYDALWKLRRQWEKEVNDANLRKGIPLPPNDEAVPEAEISYETPQFPDLEALAETTFQEDDSIANASSIAFIAEYEGCRALFAADAPADGLLAALERLYPAQTVSLDLLKVSHHGSRYTTSLPLIQKLSCPRYLISTNGSIFKHPDQESIARVVKGSREPAQLYFNYLSARNEIWDSEWLKNQYGYSTRFPNPGEQGIAIDLTV